MPNQFEDQTMEDFVFSESKASFEKLKNDDPLMESLKNTHFESFFEKSSDKITNGPFEKSLGFIDSLQKLRDWLERTDIREMYKDGTVRIKNQSFGVNKDLSVEISVIRNHEEINTSHPHVVISSKYGNFDFILFPEFKLH